jgi:hypothetical protein
MANSHWFSGTTDLSGQNPHKNLDFWNERLAEAMSGFTLNDFLVDLVEPVDYASDAATDRKLKSTYNNF